MQLFHATTGRCKSMRSYSKSASNIRATWGVQFHQIFVEICLEQVFKGNRPGTCLNKSGWRNLVESFHRETGLRYDKTQLKNHWDLTKKQWKVWWKLIGTSWMKWDSETRTFCATEEDWANYLEGNPEAAQFRYHNLQFADKLATIYEGVHFTGETEPASKRTRYNDNSTSSLSIPREPKFVMPVNRIEHPFEAVESRTGITIQSDQGRKSYSIGECIECLDSMEEVEQGSELYLFALDIFLKTEYREIFLQLKKSEVRLAWLKRLQSAPSPLV